MPFPNLSWWAAANSLKSWRHRRAIAKRTSDQFLPQPRYRSASTSEGKGRRGLAAARVVEMVAGIRRAPVRQHPDEPAVGDVACHAVLGQVGQAEAGQRRVQHRAAFVEGELALDPDPQLPPALLELPRIQAAMGRQAQVDASVGGQVLRRPRALARLAK